MSSKSIKKAIRQVQKDPKLQSMIRDMQQNLMAPSPSSDPHQRVRQRIRNLQMMRKGKGQAYMGNDYQNRTTEQKETKQTNQSVSTNVANDRSERIKQLSEKYGHITLDQWMSALKKIQDAEKQPSSISPDQLKQEQEIIELYTYQNNANQHEETLDLDPLESE